MACSCVNAQFVFSKSEIKMKGKDAVVLGESCFLAFKAENIQNSTTNCRLSTK